MKRALFTFFAAFLALAVVATDYDLNKPFGFCTRSSRTDANSTYNVTGGGCYTYPIPSDFTGKVIVLKSNGEDMKNSIQKAIKQNDVIIFDGSNGDFIVSSNVNVEGDNKTLLGINNARLCTQFHITPEIITALNNAGVPHMNTHEGGGILPNGQRVREEAEFNTRKMIIELTGDNTENYRKSGILRVAKENIIIRNITFVGPGSIDVGGNDLLSFNGAKHCWVDHCSFSDGMDGNFDITQSSDFNTVSWCTFSYTERSYMHQNTNLIGYSDREPTGFLNTTFAFNWWGQGCVQRMPMIRVGKIHMLNNYFSSTTATNCINPRMNSEVLIEGNYFEKGVRRYYSQKDAISVTWADSNFAEEPNQSGTPFSVGTTITIPYEYTVAPYADVPATVKKHAGATLKNKNVNNIIMKKTLLTLLAAIFALVATAQDQAPAFPGAEGHGRYVTGGRGGQVIHVTNLNDSGAGSFRKAVSGSCKKIVVFDVAGVIALKSDINIGANTTILGQTAPAPGITLRYYTVIQMEITSLCALSASAEEKKGCQRWCRCYMATSVYRHYS